METSEIRDPISAVVPPLDGCDRPIHPDDAERLPHRFPVPPAMREADSRALLYFPNEPSVECLSVKLSFFDNLQKCCQTKDVVPTGFIKVVDVMFWHDQHHILLRHLKQLVLADSLLQCKEVFG